MCCQNIVQHLSWVWCCRKAITRCCLNGRVTSRQIQVQARLISSKPWVRWISTEKKRKWTITLYIWKRTIENCINVIPCVDTSRCSQSDIQSTRIGSQQWQTIYFNGHLLSWLYNIRACSAGGWDYLCHARTRRCVSERSAALGNLRASSEAFGFIRLLQVDAAMVDQYSIIYH